MKHLKLFENNQNTDIDREYIEMCFVDFIDENNFIYKSHNRNTCSITIDILSSSTCGLSNSIKEFIMRSEMRTYLFKKIEDSLSKIKIEYPDMKHKIMDLTGADEEEVRIVLSTSSYLPQGFTI
jgi:hypothetical protein